MTAKRDLKKRVRARQQETGERYTAALEQVKREQPRRSRVQIVELPDVSDLARAAGLRCRAYTSFGLWQVQADEEARHRVTRAVIERLAEVLRVTEADASTALLRGALIYGRPMPPMPRVLGFKHISAFQSQRRAFAERLRLGVRGTSEDGGTISFEAPDPVGGAPLVVVATLSQTYKREPIIYLTLASEWLARKLSYQEILESLHPGILPIIGPSEGKR